MDRSFPVPLVRTIKAPFFLTVQGSHAMPSEVLLGMGLS